MPITAEDYEVIVRIVDDRVKEIKITREDFNELHKIVRELAQAQKRTEERVEELAQVQKELAEAQKRTEEEIRRLARGLSYTRKEEGGLTHTIGYTLENQAIRSLPILLKRDFEIEVKEGLKRGFLETKIGEEEVNIFGEGIKDDKKIWIVGEAQSQLSIPHIQKFLRKVTRLEENLPGKKCLVYITHSVRPSVISFAEQHNVKIYHSYELE